jgi:hypothetical protein
LRPAPFALCLSLIYLGLTTDLLDLPFIPSSI